jgi:hypothetical protein
MTGENLLILAAWYLAVASVTHVVTSDRISEASRIWFMHKVGVYSLLAFMVNCPWCISMWVAMFSTPVAVFMADRTWPQAVLLALGARYFTGILSGLSADDQEFEVKDS